MLVKAKESPQVVRNRIEARIVKLKAAKATIDDVVVRLAALQDANQREQVARLGNALAALNLIIAQKVSGLSSPVRKAINEVLSLRDAVYTGADLSDDDYMPVCVSAASVSVSQLLVQADDQLRKLSRVPISHIYEKGPAEYDMMPEPGSLYGPGLNDTKAFEHIIQQAQKEGKALPDFNGKEWTVARMPILFVPARAPVSTRDLERAGFRVSNVGGYNVVHNQLVVGINSAPSAKPANPDTFFSDHNGIVRTDLEGATPGKLFPVVHKMIEKTTRQRYVLVSDKSFSAKHGQWYWLMLERQADLFKSAFAGKHMLIRSWALVIGNATPQRISQAALREVEAAISASTPITANLVSPTGG